MVLSIVLATLTLLSLALTVWQLALAIRFPLHRRVANPAFTPGVTLLKPLKGCDAETEHCLRSWFQQDYAGPVQILFGVAAQDDPVCTLVTQLIAEHPKSAAQLVICADSLGPNAKVSTLAQLERLARHEVIIVSDADVRVPADFVSQVVALLRDPDVGLVNCFYRLANPSSLAMRLEAFVVNADFWSQVLQAQALKPLDFALGAAMATTQAALAKIGGFAALVDYLADDYQLGSKVVRSGARIALSTVAVECWSAPMGWREVWAHQLRWARTIRVCQPGPYFFSILGNATLWPLLLLLFGDRSHVPWPFLPDFLLANTAFTVDVSVQWTLLAFAGCLLVRTVVGFYCEWKMMEKPHPGSVWMAPLKDLLQVPVWALAFVGNQVTWRGQRFIVRRGGKLEKI